MSNEKESILKSVVVGSLILGAAIYYAPIALFDHKVNECSNIYKKTIPSLTNNAIKSMCLKQAS